MIIIDGNLQYNVPDDHVIAMMFETMSEDQKDKMVNMLRGARGKIPVTAIKLSAIVPPSDGLPHRIQ